MLSYQHAFHVGGPADVHKHALLWALLGHLRAKEKPFVALDLYAGEGLYALTRAEAQKIKEHERGIARLLARSDLSPDLAAYVDTVRGFDPSMLSLYPGSPALLRAAMRPQDRLIFNELHPAASTALRAWVADDPQIVIHRRDASEAIDGLLPPTIRRGLLLIDPSYELKGEYEKVANDVVRAVARWPEGIVAVWFPLLADNRHEPLLAGLKDITAPTLISQLDFHNQGLPDVPARGLRGTGLIVINPPWQFDKAARNIGDALAPILGDGPKAKHVLRWLVPER